MAGWGHTAEAWERLTVTGTEVHGLALPGHEPGGDHHPERSLAAAGQALAGDWEVVAGWSLGGLAALEALRLGTIRPRGLVLIATPPSFLARPSYPAGLAPDLLADFRSGLAADARATLQRFYALQFRGDRAPRSLWASASTRDRFLALAAEGTALARWLDVLAEADLTAAPPVLDLPVLVLHGDADAVVDPAALDFFAGYGARVTTHLIEGAGHAPHIAHAEETGNRIGEFVRDLA
jgi:pimeloyl-[acyl-carrier protein] methyl ester esterase